MMITIDGVGLGPKWRTIERVIRECVDAPGMLTRIARVDNGSNYRAPGEYVCVFTPNRGDDVTVIVRVTR